MVVEGAGSKAIALAGVTAAKCRVTAVRAGRRFAVSLILLTIIVGLQVATARDAGLHAWLTVRFGVDWDTFQRGQWYRFAVSPLFQHGPGFSGVNQYLILLVPVLEWRTGSRLTLAVFWLGDWLSTIPTLVLLRLVGEWRSAALAAADTLDSGSSSALFAVAAALVWTAPRWWLRAMGVAGLFGFLAYRVAFYSKEFDWQHLLAGCVGVAVIAIARRRPQDTAVPRRGAQSAG